MSALRRLLGVTFLAGSLGAGAELLLMAHTDGVWQLVPIALLAIGCGAMAVTPGPATRTAFRGLMLVFAAAGAAGAVLHYNGNVEFARELDPDLSGLPLVVEAMTGATPTLAPGTLLLIAAIGWGHARAAELERRAASSDSQASREAPPFTQTKAGGAE